MRRTPADVIVQTKVGNTVQLIEQDIGLWSLKRRVVVLDRVEAIQSAEVGRMGH